MSISDINSAEGISIRLCAFLTDNILSPEIDVTPETELAGIGVDSFSLMEMILYIERSFGLVLPAESLTAENIASVKTLSSHCSALLNRSNV